MFASNWPTRPTTAKISSGSDYVVKSPATRVIEHMKTKTSQRDKALGAVIALNADAGCIEAHLFLATYFQHPSKQLAHLERAVRTGQELWAPIADEFNDFAYWGVEATRPYMLALAALGDRHAEDGDVDAAASLYNQLLTMNPNDNQRIRPKLAELDETSVMAGPRM